MPRETKSSGPVSTLPDSVEASYRKKCIELKKRIREIEDSNETLILRIQRSKRGIQRARLERAFLLQQLEDRTDAKVDDSDGSPSPSPTPKDRPLRIKRSRKEAGPDSPSRPQTPSPSGDTNFPASSSYPATFTSANPAEDVKTASMTVPPPSSTKKSKGPKGPKRPPNAYMIFCDRERQNIRAQYPDDEEFDMHKALAKAWRDLGVQGQRPYFQEYDRNKEKYNEEIAAEQRRTGSSGGNRRGPRAPSAASSAAPTPLEGEDANSAPASDHDEAEEDRGGAGATGGGISAGGFTAVNR